MTLPEDFNPRNHLINQVTYWHNHLVSQYFSHEVPNDLSTPKSSLRLACTITPDDTDMMILQRQWLFEITTGHAQSLQPVVVGTPLIEYERDSKYSPQVILYFQEIYNYQKFSVQGLRPVMGRISFRLVNKTSATITPADAKHYANQIKTYFVTEKTVWHKGTYKATYLDLDNGFDLRLYCLNKSAGQNIAQQVCNVAGIPYNDANYQFIENHRTYPSNTGTQTVYGTSMKNPVYRPVADLSLRYAHLAIWGRGTPVNLVSVGMVRQNAIVNV